MKSLRFLACLLFVFVCVCSNVQGQIITTFAGTGIGSFGGDGGPATDARFSQFAWVRAVDKSGNIFVIDWGNIRIRKINSAGIISTVAGNGIYGSSGDGGPATAAQILIPRCLAVDRSGNLYFGEPYKIRKVDTSGIISTIIGDGVNGFSGDGGPATAARVSIVSSMVADTSGNIIFIDVQNNRIRKISPGGIVTTFAGNGSATYSGDGGAATAAGLYFPPYSSISLCIDSFENIYTNDTTRIRKIAPSGIISTFMSGLTWPFSFVVKSPRAIFYSPQFGIFKGDTSGSFSRITGSGPIYCPTDGTAATATGSRGLTNFNIFVDDHNNVYTSDVFSYCVVKIDSAGIIRIVAGSGNSGLGDGGPATAAQLFYPIGIVKNNGNIFICDHLNQRVRKINNAGVISTVAGTSLDGDCGVGGAATAARLSNPISVAVSNSGEVFMGVDWFIKKVSSSGIVTTVAGSLYGSSGDGPATGSELGGCSDICFDRSGNLYVSGSERIRKIDTGGIIHSIAGTYYSLGFSGDGGPATAAEINGAQGMSMDTSGNLYFADHGNHRIRKIDAYGNISTFAGNGSGGGYSGDGGAATAAALNSPSDVKFDMFGNCYIADAGNYRIRKINRYGIISTIAGNGAYAYSGDGGPATAAGIGELNRLCIDSTLNIYFTDGYGNNHIRKISATYVAAISGASVICVGVSSTLSDSTSGGSWSCSDPSIATINATTGSLTGVSTGVATVYYYTGTGVASRTITVVPPPSPGNISGPSSVCEASTITLTDTATGGTWSSSNTALATVSSSGIVRGIATGRVIISYTKTTSCGSRSAVDTITVNPLPHSGSITGASVVCAGSTISMTDTFSGGSWSSSNTSLATVNTSGVVMGVAAGSVTISYTVTNSCGTSVATHSVTVNPLTAPGSITGPSTVCEAATITLTDTATGGTWSSSNTALATVSSSGVVSGVSAGRVVISYTKTNSCGSRSAVDTITVNPLPHSGSITGASVVCAASTITLSDTSSGGTWSSSNTAIATVSSSGVVLGVSAGSVTISYTVTNSCGTSIATHAITVNPLAVAGTISGPSSVCITTTTTFTVSGASGTGTWSSSATSVATVGSTGVVTGVSGGNAIISYTVTNSCGSTSDTAMVTVRPLPVVAAITGTFVACPSVTSTLACATSGGTWSSSNPSVATISASGVVTTVAGGSTIISYTLTNSCGSTSATHAFVVNPLPDAGVISGASSLCVGATITLTDSASGGVWTSTNTAIATVDAAGVVTGITAAIDTIYYTVTFSCGATSATRVITVNPLPDAGTISGTNIVCPAATVALTCTSSTGTWSSSDNTIATVSSTGIVTGAASGSCNISYTATNTCGSASTAFSFTVLPMSFCPDEVKITTTTADLLSIYPNPAEADFTVLLSSSFNEAVTVRITNVTGQLVQAFTATTNKTIPVKMHQPAGVYFVTAVTVHGRYVGSITTAP